MMLYAAFIGFMRVQPKNVTETFTFKHGRSGNKIIK